MRGEKGKRKEHAQRRLEKPGPIGGETQGHREGKKIGFAFFPPNLEKKMRENGKIEKGEGRAEDNRNHRGTKIKNRNRQTTGGTRGGRTGLSRQNH